MLAWIVRFLLFLAAPIAALFVSRDALNFGVIEMLVAVILIVVLVLAAAAWTSRKPEAVDRTGK
jgi:competence protein ComGC